MTPRADLNGLVRFAERRNLVSARVPSHFKRGLGQGEVSWQPLPWAGSLTRHLAHVKHRAIWSKCESHIQLDTSNITEASANQWHSATWEWQDGHCLSSSLQELCSTWQLVVRLRIPTFYRDLNLLAPEWFFFNFSTPCIKNVNNTGTKYLYLLNKYIKCNFGG